MSRNTLDVASIKTVSLVDEPGKSVSVVHLQGCNFNCGFCHSAALIPFKAPGTVSLALDDFMSSMAEVFLVDGVVFTGGEPLLQPAIESFLKSVRERFDVAGVDTNGSLPKMLRKVSPHATRIAMDFKAPLTRYEEATRTPVNVAAIKESVSFLCERSRETGRVEFRITYVPPLLSIEDVITMGDVLRDHKFSDNFQSHLVLQQYVASRGVREETKNDFKTVPHDDLVILAKNIASCGLPVAVRSMEKGYVKIS